jgi:hypothetical protein
MESEKGTLDFLLTRPRSRIYFVWMSWLVGMGEMLCLVAVTQAQYLLTRDSPLILGSALRTLVGFVVLSTLIYSLTFLATLLARNSRKGTSLAVAAAVGYSGLALWLRLWFETRIPLFWDLMGPGMFGFVPRVLGWMTLSLLFVLAAQLCFQKTEA